MLRKLAVVLFFTAFVISEAQSETSQDVYVVPQGYGITSLMELDGASVCLTKPHHVETSPSWQSNTPPRALFKLAFWPLLR